MNAAKVQTLTDPLFSAAAETVWRQLFNLHHAMTDVARNDPDDDPALTEQWRLQKECEYVGGLDVLCYVASRAGLDTTVPHPNGEPHKVFSLKAAQGVLVDWARTSGKSFPANFTESAATLHI